MTNKIDPTTFKPGDIVHVRGSVSFVNPDREVMCVMLNGYDDETNSGMFRTSEIVAHFPAIRSWSEIEGRLTSYLDVACGSASDTAKDIIALLNEIDPKGDV